MNGISDNTMTQLVKIIMYLEGKLDIYNGDHQGTIEFWDMIWDEIKYLGHNPEKVDGIKEYMSSL